MGAEHKNFDPDGSVALLRLPYPNIRDCSAFYEGSTVFWMVLCWANGDDLGGGGLTYLKNGLSGPVVSRKDIL